VPTFDETDPFSAWMKGLDVGAQGRISRRVDRARDGNFGDCNSVGDGVFELCLHFGPGYRLYFFQQGKGAYLLVHGGIKKTQVGDVKRAKALKRHEEAK